LNYFVKEVGAHDLVQRFQRFRELIRSTLSRAVNTTNLRLINENLYVMTNLRFKGNWNEVKGKLKQKYGQLTDDDLTFAEGKDDELLGRLQKKLGKSKEEIRKVIESL